jgi:hypothetical protein
MVIYGMTLKAIHDMEGMLVVVVRVENRSPNGQHCLQFAK